jgi:hypothetical protein
MQQATDGVIALSTGSPELLAMDGSVFVYSLDIDTGNGGVNPEPSAGACGKKCNDLAAVFFDAGLVFAKATPISISIGSDRSQWCYFQTYI